MDLIVTGPAGVVPGAAVYYGNYFSSGQSVSGGSADPLNNVEQVYLITPEPGQYTIEVAATAVNQGTQGYALVISGRVSEGNRKPWRGFGDYDHDGDNDLVDFGFFQACFAGSGVSYGDQSCAVFDIEPDFDIDADDLTAFEGALAGPAS